MIWWRGRCKLFLLRMIHLNKHIFVRACQLFTIGTITNRMPTNLCSVIKSKTPPTKCKCACACLQSNAVHSLAHETHTTPLKYKERDWEWKGERERQRDIAWVNKQASKRNAHKFVESVFLCASCLFVLFAGELSPFQQFSIRNEMCTLSPLNRCRSLWQTKLIVWDTLKRYHWC